jgi:hypothetical protein
LRIKSQDYRKELCAMADALKAEGNKAFAAKDFNLAV